MSKKHGATNKRQPPAEIRLLDKVHLLPVLGEYGLENYKICNYFIGNDEQIHILLARALHT